MPIPKSSKPTPGFFQFGYCIAACLPFGAENVHRMSLELDENYRITGRPNIAFRVGLFVGKLRAAIAKATQGER